MPAAVHAGVHEILVIALGLACAELVGTDAPIVIDVEGHGRHDELAPTSTCRAPSAGLPPRTRWR
ncbi:linear gramicidin synthetase subunit D domain protein [Mycobacterium xenopi 3993]|nr:linear gramicidin synthetase subunit D domain protein [Mycobacterium xenopi 3993]